MNTLTLWLLISVSHHGVAATVERFPTEAACRTVRQALPTRTADGYSMETYCIQTSIVRPA